MTIVQNLLPLELTSIFWDLGMFIWPSLNSPKLMEIDTLPERNGELVPKFHDPDLT